MILLLTFIIITVAYVCLLKLVDIYQPYYAKHLVVSPTRPSTTLEFVQGIIAIIITTLVYFLNSYSDFIIGFFYALIALSFAAHVSACMVYYHAKKHPHDLQGTATFNESLSYLYRICIILPATILIMILPFFIYSPYTLGTALGALIYLAGILLKTFWVAIY